MEREDYLSKITCLTTVIDQFRDSYSLLKSSLASAEKRSADAEERNASLQSQVTRLEEVICRLTDEIRSLREEVSKQSDYTKRHNKMSYGKKSLSSRTKQDEETIWYMYSVRS